MGNPNNDRFQELFYAHYPAVRRKLFALVRDDAAADDLAQEVFLRLYRNPPDDFSYIGAWLHRVLTRIAYDHLNKKNRERALQQKQEWNAAASGNTASSSNEHILMQKLDNEEVQQWLEDLPERDRKLLMLRYSGYSYAEIAEQLELRQPQVGTMLIRAMDKLKRRALPRTEAGATLE